ncbi:MAG: hypothetical protein ABWX61_05945 [Paenisporosarcina sp.]
MEGWLKGLIAIIFISQIIQLMFTNNDSVEHIQRITRFGIAIYLILYLSTFSYA